MKANPGRTGCQPVALGDRLAACPTDTDAPSSAANKPADVRLAAFPTDLGWMGAAVSPRGLAMLTLPRPTRQAALDDLRARYPTATLAEDEAPSCLTPRNGGRDGASEEILGDLPQRLRRYLAGERVDFPQALDFTGGTPFQQQVWQALRRIPAGETRSYGWVAAVIGKPKAARAVGQAVGANPINIVVPCHRVVGSDGSLTGYGGGLPLKQRLLDLERQ